MLQLQGQTTNSIYGPSVAVSDGKGSYTAEFKVTIVQAYTVSVLFNGLTNIVGSPIANVDVFASLVQAKHSLLTFKETIITAGDTRIWKI